MQDLYKILNISEDASEKEIKKAYRKLSSQYHPDKNVGKSKEEIQKREDKFKEINEAYSVLSDKDKRAEYDHMRKYGFNSYSNQDKHYQEFDFEEFASAFKQQRSYNSSSFNSFFKDNLRDSFSEEYFAEQKLQQEQEILEKQLGYYIENNTLKRKINIPFNLAYQGGSINISLPQLSEKNGQYFVENKTISLKIKPLTKNNTVMSLKGKGLTDIKGNVGNLYLVIQLISDDKYQYNSEKNEIEYKVNVPVFDILTKQKKEIEILGKTYVINLDKSRPNIKHKLKNQEMDVVIKVEIIPTFEILDSISDKEIKSLERLIKKIKKVNK